ncbi:MAG TPA: hypothetical protein VED66_17580, partial [Candidatus Sulfotelmatobacter sp.]|nr:hypothetical protein [Candidatus Sulfotelmatobacter sp.]
EASGNYSLDLALTLQGHRQVEISLVNPRRARAFAESLGERSKTDPVEASRTPSPFLDNWPRRTELPALTQSACSEYGPTGHPTWTGDLQVIQTAS